MLTRLFAWLWRQRAWWLRMAVLAWLLTGPAPAPILVYLGPPQTVATQHPGVCVHTRLTDEVEPWKILHSLELVRGLGAPTIVEYFPWAYAEAQPGRFEWGHADLVVDYARNQGLTVIARLGGFTPAWARPPQAEQPTVDSYLAPEHYADFAAYVAAFVQHFRGRVAHIILWNEPNVTAEWGYQPVDPAGYAALIKLAYASAKAADPNIQVLAGALAPTLEPEGSDLALNDLIYLERLYAAGGGASFDALAAHAYGLSFPPDEPPAPEALNFRRVELLRQIMLAHGDASKPIYITESGWNDSPRWTRAVRPGARIDYTLAAYAWAEAHWPWAPAVCTWAFRYPAPQLSYADYFTLVTPEFQLKPIYSAIQAWTRGADAAR